MKRLFLLILVFVTLYSCKDIPPETPKKTHITLSGTIKNFKKKKVILQGFNYEKKIKFNKKKKSFSCELNVDSIPPGNYELKMKKRVIGIYLDGKNDLSFTLDFKKRNSSPKFDGDPSLVKINKYLIKKRKVFSKYIVSAMDLFQLKESKFIKKMDRYKKSLDKLLKKYKLEKTFTEKEKRNIQHLYNRNFNNYQDYYAAINQLDDFVASNKIKKKLKKIDFNNEEDYKFSMDYRFFLLEYLEESSKAKFKELEENEEKYEGGIDIYKLDLINEKVTNEYIKNILVYKIAMGGILSTENLDKFYEKSNSYSTDKDKKDEITEVFKKLEAISRGKPSPKFGKLKNFKGGETSLDDLIGKGKYIYIDIWATWCGFCKQEIPVLKSFEEKYHGKNVEFVSINVDAPGNEKKWKKDIISKEMGGVQLYAGQETKDFEFAKKFLIEGLPRFILLDPKGNIIRYNCPRPSSGYKLDEIFEELGI